MPEDQVQHLMLEQLKLLRGDVQGVKTEVQGVKAEVQGVKAEVAKSNERLDETNDRLGRVETRISAVEETVRDLAAQMLILARFVRNVGDRYERELDEVKRRLQTVEQKLGV